MEAGRLIISFPHKFRTSVPETLNPTCVHLDKCGAPPDLEQFLRSIIAFHRGKAPCPHDLRPSLDDAAEFQDAALPA